MPRRRDRSKKPASGTSSGIAVCVRIKPVPTGFFGQRQLASEGYARISLPRVRLLDGHPSYVGPEIQMATTVKAV